MSAACNPATVQPKDLTLDGVRARMTPYQLRLDELLRRYPVKRGALLQALWLIQEEFGWVPRVGIQWAADVSAVSHVHAFGVVEFYTMYKQVPTGRHLVQVCQTMCCYLQGSEDLIAHLETKLGIHCGETTADGLFTLVRVECLALCGTGPAVLIDDRAIGPDEYEQLPEDFHPDANVLDRWLAKLRAEAATTPKPAKLDELGGIVLNTKGHPGAIGAAASPQKAGYAPAPPALKLNAVSNGDVVTITWLNDAACAKLVVERSDDNGASWREIASVGAKDQKVADKLSEGQTARYRVIAHEAARIAKPSAVATCVWKAPVPPPPPPGSAPAAAPAPAKV